MTINSDIVLAQGIQVAEEQFLNFIEQPEALPSLITALGIESSLFLNEYSSISNLSDFSLPAIEIRSGEEINNAFGAYSFDKNTIYISEEFLQSSVHNPDEVANVVLEEWGHYLDNLFNEIDTPGDEGAIIASLVTGKKLSDREWLTLQTEDDTATVVIDGETTLIEQNNGFGSFVDIVPGSQLIYVNQNATGNNDGTSWENAYTNLQPALQSAEANDEIWVAQGTYYPTTDGDREQSFVINSDVRVYGGFVGDETLRSQRNWFDNQTILSGNIGNPEERTDNTIHVVEFPGNFSENFSPILNGFTIIDGYSDGILDDGAGILVGRNNNATLRNLVIANNHANFGGGGIYIDLGNANISNVAFFNNSSNRNGGALATRGVDEVIITNSLFVNNSSDFGGSAIDLSPTSLSFSEINVVNNTFVNNEVDSSSGGVVDVFYSNDVNRNFNFTNNIVLQNTSENNISLSIDESVDPIYVNVSNSIISGGYEEGENIIDAAPLFVDPNNLDFSLRDNSPAIDAGNNQVINDQGISTDLFGNPRINGSNVDLGAIESDIPEADPVYRFFIPDTGVHFYTADEDERDQILASQPEYVLESAPYNSAPAGDDLTGVAPIYRFLNTDTGVRIYTISEAEREFIEGNLTNYQSEGIAYYGYTQQIENTTPVFRFYNPVIDAHFYTSSPVERDSVLENLPDYQLESNNGVAFYVQPLSVSASAALLPDPITPTPETPTNPDESPGVDDVLNDLIR